MKKQFIVIALALVFAAFLSSSPARAQGPTPANIDDEVNRIAKGLYCPVCPNTPLDVCSTQACVQWRAQIKDMLLKGQTEEQIRDYFVRQYGQVVLGAPPAQGFNLLAYLLIPAVIILGAAIAWFTVRQWLAHRGETETAPPDGSTIPKEYADRIEKDLKEL